MNDFFKNFKFSLCINKIIAQTSINVRVYDLIFIFKIRRYVSSLFCCWGFFFITFHVFRKVIRIMRTQIKIILPFSISNSSFYYCFMCIKIGFKYIKIGMIYVFDYILFLVLIHFVIHRQCYVLSCSNEYGSFCRLVITIR